MDKTDSPSYKCQNSRLKYFLMVTFFSLKLHTKKVKLLTLRVSKNFKSWKNLEFLILGKNKPSYKVEFEKCFKNKNFKQISCKVIKF